jgi:hypothetical protein
VMGSHYLKEKDVGVQAHINSLNHYLASNANLFQLDQHIWLKYINCSVCSCTVVVIQRTVPVTGYWVLDSVLARILVLGSWYIVLVTGFWLLLTAYCLLLTAYCLLLTAYCLLLTAYCLLGDG